VGYLCCAGLCNWNTFSCGNNPSLCDSYEKSFQKMRRQRSKKWQKIQDSQLKTGLYSRVMDLPAVPSSLLDLHLFSWSVTHGSSLATLLGRTPRKRCKISCQVTLADAISPFEQNDGLLASFPGDESQPRRAVFCFSETFHLAFSTQTPLPCIN